jgi:hypothetical protein
MKQFCHPLLSNPTLQQTSLKTKERSALEGSCLADKYQTISKNLPGAKTGNTKGGSITVPLTSCLTGLDKPFFQMKAKIVSCHTADSKLVKQEVNGTVILPPFSIPWQNTPVACTIKVLQS